MSIVLRSKIQDLIKFPDNGLESRTNRSHLRSVERKQKLNGVEYSKERSFLHFVCTTIYFVIQLRHGYLKENFDEREIIQRSLAQNTTLQHLGLSVSPSLLSQAPTTDKTEEVNSRTNDHHRKRLRKGQFETAEFESE